MIEATPPNITAIVLAAGRSSRLRRPKQLIPFGGCTLIRRSVQAALYSQCTSVIVVIGAFHLRIKKELKYLDVKTVRNGVWHRGIGSSVVAGVKYCIEENLNSDAFLFIPCDQPLLSEDSIDQLINDFDGSQSIIASTFAGQIGIPALISKHYQGELLKLDDKLGLTPFLQKHSSETRTIPADFIALDVNTPEDLKRLITLEPYGAGTLF